MSVFPEAFLPLLGAVEPVVPVTLPVGFIDEPVAVPLNAGVQNVLANEHFPRWLSDEADPRDLLSRFPEDQLAVKLHRSRR
jgi:hypothetical protein